MSDALSFVVAHGSGFVAVALTVAAAAFDLREGRIPDALNATGVVAGLALAAAQPLSALATALLACSLAAASLYAVRILGQTVYGQPGMGWGDVKLAGSLGVLIGWNALWALYLAAVVGAVFGIVGRNLGRSDRLARIPFAPFIAAGTLIAVRFDVNFVRQYFLLA